MTHLEPTCSKPRNLILYNCLKRQRTFNFFHSIRVPFCNNLGQTKHLKLIQNLTLSADGRERRWRKEFYLETLGTNLLNCFLKASCVFIHWSMNKLVNVILHILQESGFFTLLLSTWSRRWCNCSWRWLLFRLAFLSVHPLRDSYSCNKSYHELHDHQSNFIKHYSHKQYTLLSQLTKILNCNNHFEFNLLLRLGLS